MKHIAYFKTTANHINLLLLGLFFWSGCIVQGPPQQPAVKEKPVVIDANMVSVTASKMKVFYIGVENPLIINAPAKVLNKLTVSVVGGGATIKKTVNGYSLIASKPGKCMVTIKGQGIQKSTEFKVKRIPDPVARLSRSSGGSMGSGEFKAQGGVGAFLNDFDFDANCSIAGFELICIAKRQDAISSINRGARYNAKSRRLIQRAKPGDTYIFDNVRAKCPGDAASRKINTMAFRIK